MEMKLNLSLRECLLRGFAALLIPMGLLAIDHDLIGFVLPLIVYLYVTAIIHFCPVKHWWRSFKRRSDDNDNDFWDRDN